MTTNSFSLFNKYKTFKKTATPSSINPFVLMGLVAIFLTCTANVTFFKQVVSIYPLANSFSTNWGFVLSTALLLLAVMSLLLLLVGYRFILKPVLIFMLLTASVTGYFTDVYGTVYDTHMLQNALQTDTAEASDLMNIKFITRIVLLGIIPTVLVIKSKVHYPPLKKAILQRLLAIVASITLAGVALAPFSSQYASFFREHKPVRFYTNPITPIYSVAKLAGAEYDKWTRPTETIMHASDAKQITKAGERKPKLVVFVVGETARADHVSFNGYSRDTFPQLAKISGLTNFSNVTSCGTSTAYSVPCMFSYTGESDYDVDTASYHENVLDTLHSLGVNILWEDNNSDSKGVMNRLPAQLFEDYKTNKNNTQCNNAFGECRDTGMLIGLEDKVAKMGQGDTLIILHQMGNHGPAYFKRYDEQFAKFTPVCETNELATCDQQSIINAFDNALLATDNFLAKTIGWLQTQQSQYDVTMLYVSDHGESLGENGIYLHGMPKQFAPESQRHVPAFIWRGDDNGDNHGDSHGKNNAQQAINEDARALSHDAITPTLLKLFDVQTTATQDKAMFIK